MDLQLIPLAGDNHILIYRPLLGLAFVGNNALADLCKKVAANPPSNCELVDNAPLNFLVQIGFFLQDIQPSQPDKIPTTAVLLLTNGCQLRCIYCYAAAGESARRKLDIRSGMAAIDHVYQQAEIQKNSSFRIDFHGGGEPSLEWHILRQLTEYARTKPIPAKISLTSNTTWTEKQCEWIIENIDRLSVSMDGSPETQDRQRPFKNTRPSSPVVMKNLFRLDKAGFTDYGIRMTVCHPWSQLSEDVRYIYEHTNCRSIQVEPAFNFQRGTHALPDKDQYHQFAQAYLAAYDVSKGYEARLTYSGARPGTMSGIFCSSPYNALVVNPEDDIVACYEITNSKHPLAKISTFGRIQDGVVSIDEQKRSVFYRLLRERFEVVCKDCFCRWTCAGDCYSRAFSESGGYLAPSSRCLMNREITKELILNLIHQQEGVWKTYSPKGVPEVVTYG